MTDLPEQSDDAWEYLFVSLPPFGVGSEEIGHSTAVSSLNSEGANGWEAVGMTPLPGDHTAVLLKRRVTGRDA